MTELAPLPRKRGRATSKEAAAMHQTTLGRNALERAMSLLFLLCGIVAVAFVLFISIYLLISGLPAEDDMTAVVISLRPCTS